MPARLWAFICCVCCVNPSLLQYRNNGKYSTLYWLLSDQGKNHAHPHSMYTQTHIHMHVHTGKCAYTHIYIHTCAYVHAKTHIHRIVHEVSDSHNDLNFLTWGLIYSPESTIHMLYAQLFPTSMCVHVILCAHCVCVCVFACMCAFVCACMYMHAYHKSYEYV